MIKFSKLWTIFFIFLYQIKNLKTSSHDQAWVDFDFEHILSEERVINVTYLSNTISNMLMTRDSNYLAGSKKRKE